MAFTLNTLNPGGSPGGRGKSPVLHTYRTADTIATVEGNDYFNLVDQLFTTGDFILVNASNGSSLYVVTNTAGDISLGAVATGTGGATAALTENGGAIGGTNNGDMPDLTVTATAPGAGADGTTPSGAQWAAAVADITDLTAAVRELAAKLNALIS